MEKETLQRERFKRFSAIFVVLALLISCSLAASATVTDNMTIVGSQSSGGSGGSMLATGGYSIDGDFVSPYMGRTVGYRFTIVDANGTRDSAPVDIIRDATCSSNGTCYGGSSFIRFASKHSMTELKNLYSTTEFGLTYSAVNEMHDTDLGLTLPDFTTDFPAWATNPNVNTILGHFGYTRETLAAAHLSLLVEPLYPMTLENKPFVLTPTEIAVYGAVIFGVDATIVSSATQDTWSFIASYTNRDWPSTMTIDQNILGYGGVTPTTNYLSFREIIEEGYGGNLLLDENIKNTSGSLTVNYYNGSEKVATRTYAADADCSNGLLNYSTSGSTLYTPKSGYTGTGMWKVGKDSSTTKIDEDTGYANGLAMSKALGADISNGNKSVNVYMEWSPNTLTVNYYNGSSLVTTRTYAANADCTNGLLNYSASDSTLYTSKAGYSATGKWKVGSDSATTKIDEDTGYANGLAMSKALNADISGGNKTASVYMDWNVNKLTVNYHSNGATSAFSGAPAVSSSTDVTVLSFDFFATSAYPNGLHDYTLSSHGTYLAKTGYTATGNWGTTKSGGTTVSQSTAFTNGMDLAKALGKDITSESTSVDVYAQWTPAEAK